MPKRRGAIAMTEEEREAYLREEGHTLQVASLGPGGYPHLVAMWYALIDGKVHFTTFAKSQKVLNLRRDPKITVMVESGSAYHELRGVVIEGTADIIEGDIAFAARVAAIAGSRRPGAPAPSVPPSEQALRAVAKRVVIRVNPVTIYSWDHRKLGGTY